ncbi:uncharacterized protein Dwil_GK18458 [Drosophila willistoni]|uniref:Major facilitator superfamily (MFS) profile domain-containing protein n=1 Tax=Drosophila willistoni TaxID=7260 RepID=B4NLR6_DROWI|nr:facilitated trehalose transporter Tret1 [Drosophila willistoni]EDW85305.1 uncharacterized protein Dwil_GK18458 [Drosophila willistoni]
MVSGEAGGLKYQYLAAICVNIISISYGAFCGWPSASFLELGSSSSPLETGPLTPQDQGWVASTLCLGGIAGTIFFAWLADRIGRKQCLLWLALPALVGWIIIPFARNPMHLIAARFIGGTAGGGCFAVIPIYTAELAEDSIRGVLGTLLVLTCNFGVLTAFALGYYFNYATVAWIMSTLSFVFVACFWFMPETPQHLAQHNKVEEAELSLRYYRNIRSRASKDLTEELQLELQKLRVPTEKDAEAKDDLNAGKDSGVSWSDFAEPKARKAFSIGMGLIFFNQMCGCFAMLNYTAVIFQQSGSDLSPTISAIAVGGIQLLGTYCSTVLVERLGRKILLLISAVGICLGQCSMGGFSLLKFLGHDTSSFNWVPVAGFSFMLFIASWGMLSLPFLVISEIMPPKIRNMANMLCMTFLWVIATCTIKAMPLLTDSMGMHGTVFLFATFSFLGAIFVAIFVPETKGKTIETLLASL